MGVITLNVVWSPQGDEQSRLKKAMQFESTTLVFDACKIIREKVSGNNINPKEYGLFRLEEDPTKCVWMENGRTLEYYLVRNGDTVEYKKKIRPLKVRMLDGAVKTVLVDESQPVGEIMVVVCSKIGISNHEEYSMVRQSLDHDWRSTLTLKEERRGKSEERGLGFGTLGRNKEKKMEQLRAKLHTDEELLWLDHGKTLREQAIADDETLILRRKFFFSDTNVDCRDPVQLNLLYEQCKMGVLQGNHPVPRDLACDLAALQCQIQYGDFQEHRQRTNFSDLREILPKEYVKSKDNEKRIMDAYRELAGKSELDAKSKYVHLCRSLLTYGVTFFVVKEKMKGKNKLVPRLLGVNKECVMRMDEKTKEVLQEWPLEQVRRWAASPKTFTLDFGDYQDGYYSVQTADGEKIAQLIAGYIDIILRKKRTFDHVGIEGDEGSTMLEDVVAPARATLVAHGQIGEGFAHEGSVAIPGVLRTHGGLVPGQRGMLNGAQYGAVSGQILQQQLTKGQRPRVVDSQERAQRALIGTIEASIRAVEAAEEEMKKPVEIQIPRFIDDPTSRRWMETKVEVEKQKVGDQLAQMGAATAEVVQLTAVADEVDTKVGTAIATIGSNMPEMGRGVRELAALLPDEQRRGDLVDAARKLCGAFSDFLTTVNPEHEEKRTTVLAAAGRVGDFSQAVINTLDEPTSEVRTFHDNLVQRAKNVATSTAQLVLRAKTISAECEEPALQDKVIHSATQCAYATSQLVACARVVAPTIDSPVCQEQLTSAAKQVARAVEDLLVDAQNACTRSIGDGKKSFIDIHEASRQVTAALDDLLLHVKSSPKLIRTTQENYEYEQILNQSRKIITYQGPTEGMVRQGENAIRHSRLLVEQMEAEADRAPERRDRLLDAARSVAQATSRMIDATKECQVHPQAAESQIALRNAAEKLVTVTSEATSEEQSKRTMEYLEQAAKQAAAAATQTIAAANSCQPYIQSKTTTETLIIECTETAERVPPLIASIRESQAARSPSEKFRAQSNLIRDTTQVLRPATRLVEVARQTVPSIPEQHVANHLQSTSQQLSTQLAELRVALNNAKQLNFEMQLAHSEDLIRELDNELVEIGRAAQYGQLTAVPGESVGTASSKLASAARQVGSTLTQMVSAVASGDRQHVGASAVEAAQSLRTFVSAIHGVCSTRKDTPVDRFIVSARSVVHDSGRVFDKVREQATSQQLNDTTKQVAVSLRQCLSCLPDTQHVEKAVSQIKLFRAPETASIVDLRGSASRLIEACSQLAISLQAPQEAAAVDVFVRSYTDFHTAVTQAIKQQQDSVQRQQCVSYLETARKEAVNVVWRIHTASMDVANASALQLLSQSTRSLTESVNAIVENVSREAPWQRECDAALRQIKSIRYILDRANLPINNEGYYESLDSVTEQAKRLGEGMTGIARHAKNQDTHSLCESVHIAADAICGLAEGATQSAYLIGVADAKSQPGQAAIIDTLKCQRSIEIVKQICERIERMEYTQQQILDDATVIAKHTSTLANLCREASERTSNVNLKKQFINCAREVASSTASLITAVKQLDSSFTEKNQRECTEAARSLYTAAQQLETFVDNPDFAAVPAKISTSGEAAQKSILLSGKEMLDASCEMIITAKQLAMSPADALTWQRLADNSKVVSESIKRLVTSIREQPPGQVDLDAAIVQLQQMIQQIDRASMDAFQGQLPRGAITEQRVHQQILHACQSLYDRIELLREVAIGHSEELGHRVHEHMEAIVPLVQSSIQAASITYDTKSLTTIFEQCKTVVEAELQMLYACRNICGNPKAHDLHVVLYDSASQLRDALTEMQRNVNRMASEAGIILGVVENISRSIALTDEATSQTITGTFIDAQTRMISVLEEISRLATDMPLTSPESLGSLALRFSERYSDLAMDSRLAIATLSSPNLAQKLRVAVQKLGTACIEEVKIAGQRRGHPNDQRILDDLSRGSQTVVERVQEVLAALHEGSRGTQACINAANTVSGIIGDLDTTIMFATAGSLNPQRDSEKFGDHREAILKTAKALVEDTKALVAGAASNQEQLAVAAQNAVRTIVNLSDAVKNGAVSLSSDNAEAQVMVIHAVRDVAAALSNLIQATKNASGRSLHDPAMGHLKEAAKVMVTNVTSLLKTVKTIEDEHQRGTRALEAAIEAIGQEISLYDSGEAPSRGGATAEDLIKSTKQLTAATARAAAAAQTLQQSDIIAAANIARQSVCDLLATTRAAALCADSADARYRTLDCGREVAVQVRSLLITLQTLIIRRDDPHARDALLEASRRIARVVGELASCGELLKGDSWTDPSDPTAVAENELIGAANSIEAAAVKLSQLRPRQTQKVDDSLTFDEQILAAAKSIATAVQTLVKAASAAQRELVAQGRLESHPAFATDDYQWSEGLISASRLVAAAVHQLCEAANALVASSTAHLLVACKVKSDLDSRAMQRLQSAGHAVKTATEHLVMAARSAIHEDERTLIISQRMVSGIAQVMDAQEQVLRKERELTEARGKLAALNKARYERGMSP
uniref:FERM domain-containing protein n=1 Tax=Onchocerca volvulus TaxID=6282 RepID=A0A8R1TSD6_ONCVO